MSELKRTHALAALTFSGDPWHGPSLMEVLKGVSAAQAARKPLPAIHSIWELVLHCAFWKEAVLRQMAGEKVSPADEENFPPATDVSEDSWRAAQKRLADAQHHLLEAIARMRIQDLESGNDPGPSMNYIRLHGIIHHDLYHAGQIAILKKA